MTLLLTYAITLFGFCYVVGQSAISLPMRRWFSFKPFSRWPLALIECPACLSFWLGTILGIVKPDLAHSIAGDFFGSVWIFPYFSAGLSAILGLLTGVMA